MTDEPDISKAIHQIWGSALREQLTPIGWLPLIPRPPLSRRAKVKRWVRFYTQRIRDTWNVLWHGLPEQW